MTNEEKIKETELKLHPCYCGGEMEIKKVTQDGGMDGMYENWELSCKKCGLTMTYAADNFYGRKYKTFEEVIDDWNRKKKEDDNKVKNPMKQTHDFLKNLYLQNKKEIDRIAKEYKVIEADEVESEDKE